ncbi:uncharacterized protein METZ01_LOCUS158824, partial [marine metagenome]
MKQPPTPSPPGNCWITCGKPKNIGETPFGRI